jgi:hypothetical protein
LNNDFRDTLSTFIAGGDELLLLGAWATRIEVFVDGMTIPLLGCKDLIRKNRRCPSE